MTIKTILVPVDGSPASFATLERAFVVAARFDSHVKALHVMPHLTDGGYNLPAKMRAKVEEEAGKVAHEQAAELREQFIEFCDKNAIALTERPRKEAGPTAQWCEERGQITDVLVEYGRVSDMIAAARPRVRRATLRRSPMGENIEALMLRTGRPVLIVPPKAKPKQCEHVAIGWNESLEASRALAMTMPWLAMMGTVTIIVSKRRKPRVQGLVEYLLWHGVLANVALLEDKGDSVGESILKVCSDVGAELLVVGGFSHARARELLFGGVTRHLLCESKIMTVMVH